MGWLYLFCVGFVSFCVVSSNSCIFWGLGWFVGEIGFLHCLFDVSWNREWKLGVCCVFWEVGLAVEMIGGFGADVFKWGLGVV